MLCFALPFSHPSYRLLLLLVVVLLLLLPLLQVLLVLLLLLRPQLGAQPLEQRDALRAPRARAVGGGREEPRGARRAEVGQVGARPLRQLVERQVVGLWCYVCCVGCCGFCVVVVVGCVCSCCCVVVVVGCGWLW